jgi:hypothetical protein
MENFMTSPSVYLVIRDQNETKMAEWAGLLPDRHHVIRLVDGDEMVPLIVLRVEFVAALTGSGDDSIVSPSEIYIHARRYGENQSITSESDPEIISADTHPVLITNNVLPDPER